MHLIKGRAIVQVQSHDVMGAYQLHNNKRSLWKGYEINRALIVSLAYPLDKKYLCSCSTLGISSGSVNEKNNLSLSLIALHRFCKRHVNEGKSKVSRTASSSPQHGITYIVKSSPIN